MIVALFVFAISLCLGVTAVILFRHPETLSAPTQEGIDARLIRLGIKCGRCKAIRSPQDGSCRCVPPPPPPLPLNVGTITHRKEVH